MRQQPSSSVIYSEGGAQVIEIEGSNDFGRKTNSKLPSYGMYLKTKSNDSFAAQILSLSENTLTVSYSGGVADQYVVVHAFKEDSLTNGHTSYVAAAKLSSGSNSVNIDVSAWNLNSLGGYTIKVWMEDISNDSRLAAATMPVTFDGGSMAMSSISNESTNPRVFAMKDELKTSWGSLSTTDSLIGADATNQKIYFGTYSGSPMEFWIAGRETAVNGGMINEKGNIMTLYQAIPKDGKPFNTPTSDYGVDGKLSVTLKLSDGISEAGDYPLSDVIFTQGDVELDKSCLKWQHRMLGSTAWSEGMPTANDVPFLGTAAITYEIRCYAQGTENYERTYSEIVDFTPLKTPTANDFVFIPPTDLTYNGTAKEATLITGKNGMGAFTVSYYDSNGVKLSGAPINAGTYSVKVDIGKGTSYGAVSGLTDANWTFTINKKVITFNTIAMDKIYDGNTSATIGEISFDGLVDGEVLIRNVDYAITAASFESSYAGIMKYVAVEIALMNNVKVNNYELNNSIATTTANIIRKEVTISSVIAENRKYEAGNTEITLSGGKVCDAIEEDDVSVDLTNAKGIIESAAVGDSKNVTVTGVALAGYDATNYILVAQPTGVTVTISKADGPAAPTTVVGNDCTTVDNNDGILTGLAVGMEYKKSTDSNWTACTSDTISNLTAGSYEIRIAETSTHKAGQTAAVVINAHSHEFGTKWELNDENHWHECHCGHKSEEAAHIPGAAATENDAQTCTVCGYELAAKLIHKPVLVKGYDATDTAPGKKDYYHCDSCGRNYADEEGTDEITDDIDTWCAIPKINNIIKDDEDKTEPDTGDMDDVPHTGDSGDMLLWYGLIIALGFGVSSTVLQGRRNEQ